MQQQILYFGGPIITMKDQKPIAAVLTQGDRILYTGDLKQAKLLSNESVKMVDLQGKTLLPSFIDAHSHITSFAQTLGLAQLSDATDFKDIQQSLQEYVEQSNLKKGEWVIGFGYDHNRLTEKMHPDKTILDQVCPDHPVMIAHQSGHMGVLNSMALEQMEIHRDSQTEGGVIAKSEDGEPTGYLEETAFTGLKPPAVSVEQQVRNFERAQQMYFRYGITTAQEGMVKKAEWDFLKYLSENHRLKIDLVSYIDLIQHRFILLENPQYLKKYHNGLKIGGYKIFLDGSPQGRTAWLTEPYLGGKSDDVGYAIHSFEQVLRWMKLAISENMQLLVHCNGDAACQQMLDAYESAQAEMGGGGIRPVMIHAQLVRKDQLQQMHRLSMIASFFVAHTYYWGDTHIKNLGMQRAKDISPVQSAIRNQVVYTFHQDTPVIAPNMMETIWCAVNRMTKDGIALNQDERVSVYDALCGVTKNAAYQYYEENDKGTIEPGKLADFVILDRNPLTVQRNQIREIQILQTIKSGQTVYQKEEI